MSDLIKSITTTAIKVNDVLEEAFEATVEATPGNNDLVLSYNPTSQTLGKSTFPALQQQLLPVDLRALKIDKTINTVPLYTTIAPVVYTIDPANVQELNCISLSILQYHSISFQDVIELEGSKPEKLNGFRNEYLIVYKGGLYYFSRSYKLTSEEVINVGAAQALVSDVTADSVELAYDAENALTFKIERYLTPDYSDPSVQIYLGDQKLFSDIGRSSNTSFYYKITGINGEKQGAPALISAKTAIAYSNIVTITFPEDVNKVASIGPFANNGGGEYDGQCARIGNGNGDLVGIFTPLPSLKNGDVIRIKVTARLTSNNSMFFNVGSNYVELLPPNYPEEVTLFLTINDETSQDGNFYFTNNKDNAHLPCYTLIHQLIIDKQI